VATKPLSLQKRNEKHTLFHSNTVQDVSEYCIFIFTSVVFKQAVMIGIQCNVYKQLFFKCQLSSVEGCVRSSNGSDIETKAEQSFDLGFVFDIEAKQTCLFQNL
jgi:hypothetical protein